MVVRGRTTQWVPAGWVRHVDGMTKAFMIRDTVTACDLANMTTTTTTWSNKGTIAAQEVVLIQGRHAIPRDASKLLLSQCPDQCQTASRLHNTTMQTRLAIAAQHSFHHCYHKIVGLFTICAQNARSTPHRSPKTNRNQYAHLLRAATHLQTVLAQ